MMAETIEEVQSSLGKIKRMSDSTMKKEFDYENENDSNQMLIIIYGQIEKLKKKDQVKKIMTHDYVKELLINIIECLYFSLNLFLKARTEILNFLN